VFLFLGDVDARQVGHGCQATQGGRRSCNAARQGQGVSLGHRCAVTYKASQAE
jgi:hypothetical protein